jgi:hypothetical protein
MLAQIRVGDEISSKIFLGDDDEATNWDDCIAGLLPLGITLSRSGEFTGTVQYDHSRSAVYLFNIVAFASTSQGLWHFNGPGLEVNNIRAAQEDSTPHVDSNWFTSSVRMEVRNAGFEAFEAFESYWGGHGAHAGNHQLATATMLRNRGIMSSRLLNRWNDPATHDEWLLLGVVEMRRHKLMADVLVDAEAALTRALLLRLSSSDYGRNESSPWPCTLPGWASLVERDSHLANVRSNLDGCLSKRKLEAAKALYDRAVKEVRDQGQAAAGFRAKGDGEEVNDRDRCQTHASFAAVVRAVSLLERALALKEGWGWGMDQVTIRSAMVDLKGDWQAAMASRVH